MRIHILLPPDTNGARLTGVIDESELIKTSAAGVIEYRLPDSSIIVHRSCELRLRGTSLSPETANFGGHA